MANDTEQGGATGVAEQSGTTGTATTGSGTSTQQQSAGGTGDQARPGASSSEKAYTYKEDRSNWIPKHRFDEVSQQAQRARDLEAAVADREAKIAALAGVTRPNPDDAQAEKIKEAFFNLPGMGAIQRLAQLSDEQLEALLQVPSHIERTSEAELRQWQRHGNQQVQYVGERVAEALGAETPDPEQLEDLRLGLSAWIKKKAMSELEASDGRSSDTIRRYEEGDQKLLDEFAASYTKRWVEPARRQATAHTLNRMRPVPSSAGRSPVSTTQRPDTFKSMDERLDYAVKIAKERGVQFGR